MIAIGSERSARFISIFMLTVTTLLMPLQALSGVVLGNTRVIYPSEAREVTLPLKNTETSQTFLIQSAIESADGGNQLNFVVTPPLFVLKPGGENKVRVFLKSASPLPTDRESLFWMRIKAVPSAERKTEGNFVQFAVTNRIKLLYRPQGLGAPDEKTLKQITVRLRGDEVVMYNPSPFYMNISMFTTGSLKKESLTLAPNETLVMGSSKAAAKKAEVVFINDFGGESEKITVPVT